jgi:hypothetical protein
MMRMRRRRAAAQLLHRPPGSAADAVRHLVAVQAQDARSARLAVRARVTGFDPSQLDTEAFAVTWLLRGTLHLVHVDDLPWLHALAPPPEAPRLRQLGVDEAMVGAVRAALPFTRAEAGELFGLRGQAVPHLLKLASLRGVCMQDLGGRFRPVELPPVTREQALRELARRYAVAHPGADRRDLARWSGVGVRELEHPIVADDEALAPPETPPRLLPAFDPYLLGWRDRGFAVPEPLAARVFPGGGMFRATAVVDGRVCGTWTVPGGRVKLELDGSVDPAVFADEVAEVELS